MKYTVIGSSGFIGSHMVTFLESMNKECFCPDRDYLYNKEIDLGTVFYCAGYGDCKNNIYNVIDANVNKLKEILTQANFQKLVYVSSTRIYLNSKYSAENSDLNICHNDERKLFNLTKLVAEELCLRSNKDIVIVRPSNVYGLALNSTLFLPQIIKNAINNNHVDMYVNSDYEKDYVSVDDVVTVMYKLAESILSSGNIYNIASGYNVSAKSIANILGLS
ncbi:SDR family oxidoreductase [Morganella morganii]|uniref:SDR family oxidoreductase n=1 Tax=Morganella morganii TaxID=582 RepID=UPI003F2529DA